MTLKSNIISTKFLQILDKLTHPKRVSEVLQSLFRYYVISTQTVTNPPTFPHSIVKRHYSSVAFSPYYFSPF